MRVENLAKGEVRSLSQLIQHSIHHFTVNGEAYLLLPATFTHIVAQQLAGRINIVESNLQGCALVAPSSELSGLKQQAEQLFHDREVVVRFAHHDSDYALFLTDQALASDLLAVLHD